MHLSHFFVVNLNKFLYSANSLKICWNYLTSAGLFGFKFFWIATILIQFLIEPKYVFKAISIWTDRTLYCLRRFYENDINFLCQIFAIEPYSLFLSSLDQ